MATRPEDRTEEPQPRRHARGERERAARYLDLWERNICHNAVHAAPPFSLVRPSGRPAPERE